VMFENLKTRALNVFLTATFLNDYLLKEFENGF
jgi:hypothetical protein